MKYLVLTAVLIGFASATLSASQLQHDFAECKKKFGKDIQMLTSSSGSVSDKERFEIFTVSANFVEEHNNQESNWVAETNKFSLETPAELQLNLGLNVSEIVEEQRRSSLYRKRRESPKLSKRSLEADYTPWLPPVKDQGSCGSCWAFGATVALEYQVNKARNAETDTMRSLSEQQYLDCVYETQNHDGCNGGWPATCYSWSKDNGNMIASTKDMPYTAKDGACKTNTHSAISGFNIEYTQYLWEGDSYMLDAAADPEIGVLSVAIGVVNSFYSYSSGVYSETGCSSINHAVDVVGYGVANGEGYWRCRNSWGSWWGDEGYINMKRGLSGANINTCAIASYAHYPVVSGADDGSNDDNDGDDSDGDGNDDDEDSTDDPCWVSGVGDFSSDQLVGETDYMSHSLCNSMCGATAGCEAAVLSPETDANRVCYMVNTENVGPRDGYTTAKQSCYRDDDSDDDNGEDMDVCEWVESVGLKGKGFMSDWMSLEDCEESCPVTAKCKQCSCKNKNKCKQCKKNGTKSNSKFTTYKMQCSK